MSVIGTYIRLDPGLLDDLRKDKEWLTSIYRRRVPGAEMIDIDKACDGLAWLLLRVPQPGAPPIEGSGFVLRRSLAPLLCGQGGKEEPELEAGYGPAKFLTLDEVRQLSTWLATLDPAQLRAVYEPRAMARDQVYPQIWMRDGQAALDEYLLPRFVRLREFVHMASREGQSLLVCFT